MSTERSKAALSSLGPYGRLACAYAIAGVPTFPVCPLTKKPMVRQFGGRAPSLDTIKTWARRHPEANLGFSTRRARVVVLDADDHAALAYFQQHAEPPILRTQTPKGEHWWFADPGSRRRGANRPTSMAFDIKGAKACDFVILPGSVSARGIYRLADGDQNDVPGLVAERLRRLTTLADAAYAALTGGSSPPLPGVAVRRPASAEAFVGMGLDRVPEGHRNRAVFIFARRQCRLVRRNNPDAEGEAILVGRVAQYNRIACDPPLDDAEVEKTALSAWRWELAHMRRLPANRSREVRRSLIEHPGEARAVALLLVLSQTTTPGKDLQLSPTRLVEQRLVANWSRTDYRCAIEALVVSGRLRVLERPRRGRGNVGFYRLASPLLSIIDAAKVLDRLSGDADATALYGLVAEQWGLEGDAGLSVRGMCAQRGGPFGAWDERRLRRARQNLEAVGLLRRHAQPSLGPKTPRAMFSVRSLDVPSVPKITGIAPGESHRPPGLGEGREFTPVLLAVSTAAHHETRFSVRNGPS